MALIDYSSSSSSDDQTVSVRVKIGQKRKRPMSEDVQVPASLPPLPSKFHDLYASNARTSTLDDPSLHGGRTRATPHVEGNWPTHMYVEWHPSETEHGRLASILSLFKDSEVHSLLVSTLSIPAPLHISLSRPLVLQSDQKALFLEGLENAYSLTSVHPFVVETAALDWVANDEGTRWFLVLRIRDSNANDLSRLLDVTNRMVKSFDLEPLYDRSPGQKSATRPQGKGIKTSKTARSAMPKNVPEGSLKDQRTVQPLAKANGNSTQFHISIGWSLDAPTAKMRELLTTVESKRLTSTTHISISTVKIKIGNVVASTALNADALTGKGLIGA